MMLLVGLPISLSQQLSGELDITMLQSECWAQQLHVCPKRTDNAGSKPRQPKQTLSQSAPVNLAAIRGFRDS